MGGNAMARATQLCVTLVNTPGMLAKLGNALARANVNVEAISVVDTVDCGQVRLVASPVAKAKAALDGAKMCYCTQPVVTTKVPNAPGQLGKVAGKLAKAKININYVYGSVGSGDTPALLVFGVDDLQKAVKVLA
jgi:hypothetical protein